jgi:glycosyltransferase involved in cell wall biosynthesis
MNESTRENKVELSVVSTIYNDSQTIKLLVSELLKYIEPLSVPFEIILVNDHSYDNSEEEIKKVCETNPLVKGISLARNYGQQIAVSAGIKQASGNYVLIIDGDLENPIDAIPVLYKKIKENYDIVYAVSNVRQSFLKKITSDAFWFVICKLLKITIVKNQLLLRIMSRRLADHYNSYPEISRSVAGITHDIGLKSTQVEVTMQKRVQGKSNYNFTKRLNIFIDIALNLSLKPLNFIMFLGFFTFLLSIIGSGYYLYLYFTLKTLPGYTSTILAIFFFGSIIIFTLGIMSRYLSLIYLEVRNRPLFLVKEKYNL